VPKQVHTHTFHADEDTEKMLQARVLSFKSLNGYITHLIKEDFARELRCVGCFDKEIADSLRVTAGLLAREQAAPQERPELRVSR
jgi:hypothetical protein